MFRDTLQDNVYGLEARVNELSHAYSDEDEDRWYDAVLGDKMESFQRAFASPASNGGDEAYSVLEWRQDRVQEAANQLVLDAKRAVASYDALKGKLYDQDFQDQLGAEGLNHSTGEYFAGDADEGVRAVHSIRESLDKLMIASVASDEYVEGLMEEDDSDLSFYQQIRGNEELQGRLQGMDAGDGSVWDVMRSNFFDNERFYKRVRNPMQHGDLLKTFDRQGEYVVFNDDRVPDYVEGADSLPAYRADHVMREVTEYHLETAETVVESLLESEYVPGDRDEWDRNTTWMRKQLNRLGTAQSKLKKGWKAGKEITILLAAGAVIGGSLYADFNNERELQDIAMTASEPLCEAVEEPADFRMAAGRGDAGEQASQVKIDIEKYGRYLDVRRHAGERAAQLYFQKVVPEELEEEYEARLDSARFAVPDDSVSNPGEYFEEVQEELDEFRRLVEAQTVFEDALSPAAPTRFDEIGGELKRGLFERDRARYPDDPLVRSMLHARAIYDYVHDGTEWAPNQAEINDWAEEMTIGAYRSRDPIGFVSDFGSSLEDPALYRAILNNYTSYNEAGMACAE